MCPFAFVKIFQHFKALRFFIKLIKLLFSFFLIQYTRPQSEKQENMKH